MIQSYYEIERKEIMIQIKDVSKSFNNVKILDKLNCTITDNCIYGLVGANGSGKSTLLRLINGIYKQEEGTITMNGEELFNNATLKQKIVFVPDDLFFYPGYTLKDMFQFYQALYPKFDEEYAVSLAKMFKLDQNRKISTFSKGMKRQCALIASLATNAEYMFFDETFDGLDPVVRNTMKKLIAKKMSEQNTTIIMTSHNLRELEDICDRLGLLYKGGILFESEIDNLKTNMYKVQISFAQEKKKEDFKGIDILSFKKVGSIITLVIKDEKKTSRKILEKMKPVILDYLPLTLEEIFIYEMEVLGYEFEEII